MERTNVASYLAELDGTLGLLHQLVTSVRSLDGESPELGRVLAIADALYRQQPSLRQLPQALQQAYAAITAALGDIRVSREAIRSHALDRLHRTHERLAEVTSATESATTAILDGLDRALGLVARLEEATPASGGSAAGAADPRALAQELRGQLNGLYEVLQFQDITSQQLGAAGDLLVGVEQRLQGVAALLEPDRPAEGAGRPPLEPEPARTGPAVYDERASTRERTARQELVDTIMAEAARQPLKPDVAAPAACA